MNVLVLRVAFPALNIYLLGIKLDLMDAETWRCASACPEYLLHAIIYLVVGMGNGVEHGHTQRHGATNISDS